MNCQEVRQLSSDYLDQRLTPSELSSLEEHLKLCSGCRHEVEALRRTISLIGSLDEIETSPDFLVKVHRKIDRKGKGKRVWAWFFKPVKLKVPLEVMAILFLGIVAFRLYQESPELSREIGGPAALEDSQIAPGKPGERALEKGVKSRESYRIAGGETEPSAELKAQLSKRKLSLDTAVEVHEEVVASTRQAEIREVMAEDVALYEQRVKVVLKEIGGRLLSQEGSFESGLLLTVEMPESRQAEFLAALKEGVRFRTKSKFAKGKQSRAGGYVEEKDAVSAAARKLAPALESSRRTDELMVTLRLRILPKK